MSEKITKAKVLVDAHAIVSDTEDEAHEDENGSKRIEQTMLVVGTSAKDWPFVMDRMRKSHQGRETQDCYYAVGVHPWFVDADGNQDEMKAVHSLLTEFPALRIGEIGLDAHPRVKQSFVQQVDVFKAQLNMACELQRSVSIHCVRAHGTLMEALKQIESKEAGSYIPKGIFFHSWNGSEEITRQILRLKYVGKVAYFGVSAKINKEAGIKKLLQFVPKERILTESDLSLYDPKRIPSIVEAIETLEGALSADEIQANFVRFLTLMTHNEED
jgi:TatD DNase family protein